MRYEKGSEGAKIQQRQRRIFYLLRKKKIEISYPNTCRAIAIVIIIVIIVIVIALVLTIGIGIGIGVGIGIGIDVGVVVIIIIVVIRVIEIIVGAVVIIIIVIIYSSRNWLQYLAFPTQLRHNHPTIILEII